MVFAIHQHESAMGVPVPLHPEPSPPYPSGLSQHQLWVPCFLDRTCTGCLFYIWQYTCFSGVLSNHPTLAFSHGVQKSVLYISDSSAAMHVELLVPSF